MIFNSSNTFVRIKERSSEASIEVATLDSSELEVAPDAEPLDAVLQVDVTLLFANGNGAGLAGLGQAAGVGVRCGFWPLRTCDFLLLLFFQVQQMEHLLDLAITDTPLIVLFHTFHCPSFTTSTARKGKSLMYGKNEATIIQGT